MVQRSVLTALNYKFANKYCTNKTKRNFKKLKVDKTMELNGIPDEKNKLTDLRLPHNLYVSGILLHYNDDWDRNWDY